MSKNSLDEIFDRNVRPRTGIITIAPISSTSITQNQTDRHPIVMTPILARLLEPTSTPNPNEILRRTLQNAIDEERPLELEEYDQIFRLNEAELQELIDELYDEENDHNSFFTLTILLNNEEFPILSYAMQTEDRAFAIRLINALNQPQYTDSYIIMTTLDPLNQTPLEIAFSENYYSQAYNTLISIAGAVPLNSETDFSHHSEEENLLEEAPALPPILLRTTLGNAVDSDSEDYSPVVDYIR